MTNPAIYDPNRDNKSPFGDSQAQTVRHADFAERLVQAAELAGFNASRLAAATGLTRGTMARYWRGERLLPADLLFHVADILNVDARWLITGQSTRNSLHDQDEDRLLATFQRLSPEQREHVAQSAELLASPRTLHSPRRSFKGK